jgi:hypothetical protein
MSPSPESNPSAAIEQMTADLRPCPRRGSVGIRLARTGTKIMTASKPVSATYRQPGPDEITASKYGGRPRTGESSDTIPWLLG